MSIEILRKELAKFAKGKQFIQGAPLVSRLAQKTNLNMGDVEHFLYELYQLEEIQGGKWNGTELFAGKISVHVRLAEHETDYYLNWQSCLHNSVLSEIEQQALQPPEFAQAIEGLSIKNMEKLLRGLLRLKQEQFRYFGKSSFIVSANYLLGSSKLLGSLPKANIRAFGIEIDKFSSAENYVIVSSPKKPKAVILVENPQAFELALQADCNHEFAWIVTHGYGLSKIDSEYGNQLAAYIEGNAPLVSLYRNGEIVDLPTLFAHKNLQFWGDLDKEGMRIFWRLKRKLQQLKLCFLYEPMIEKLQHGEGHPYVKAVGKPKQRDWRCHDEEVCQYLEICQDEALDQEAISVELLKKSLLNHLDKNSFNY